MRGWGARPGGWTRPSAGSSMWSVTLPVTEQKMSQRMLEAEAIWMDFGKENGGMLTPKINEKTISTSKSDFVGFVRFT